MKKEIDLKKMKYFELKVVKVKKQPKDSVTIFNQCPICKEIHKCNFKKQGNWVNGENLDKVDFPCLCEFMIGSEIHLGIMLSNFFSGYHKFELHLIDKQRGGIGVTAWGEYTSLEKLFKDNKVKILKGKIILFEEEK